MLIAYPSGDGHFQQDNAFYYSAGIVQDWFQEHAGKFDLLRWTKQSTDHNSIDRLWHEVKRAIRHLDPKPSNLILFEINIHQSWSDFTNDL